MYYKIYDYKNISTTQPLQQPWLPESCLPMLRLQKLSCQDHSYPDLNYKSPLQYNHHRLRDSWQRAPPKGFRISGFRIRGSRFRGLLATLANSNDTHASHNSGKGEKELTYSNTFCFEFDVCLSKKLSMKKIDVLILCLIIFIVAFSVT